MQINCICHIRIDKVEITRNDNNILEKHNLRYFMSQIISSVLVKGLFFQVLISSIFWQFLVAVFLIHFLHKSILSRNPLYVPLFLLQTLFASICFGQYISLQLHNQQERQLLEFLTNSHDTVVHGA